jgi:hypothetical protein
VGEAGKKWGEAFVRASPFPMALTSSHPETRNLRYHKGKRRIRYGLSSTRRLGWVCENAQPYSNRESLPNAPQRAAFP